MSNEIPKKKLLNDVYKHSDKGEEEFIKRVDETIIDATEVFKCKKIHDQWWDKALKRFNKLNNLNKKDDE